MSESNIHYESITLGEEEQLYSCMKQIDQEVQYMLYSPNERKYDKEQITKMINDVSRNGLLLAAWDDAKIVGYILVQVSSLKKTKHIGYVVLGVLSKYSHKGIGTRLIDKALSWAKENTLHRVELSVVSENIPAVKLYKKMGFICEGIRKDSILLDGKFLDEYYMRKIIK
ncbi:GNAT family N-acetyltransferase [Tetragenococcus koreensis]|uniref:GNAT family N-acetyltransferase n=1 Tax=Tetragenococcus koreensis TaxID=290335 RepID=UPI001F2A071D|nr:GNAT family N-acetyltransferase [Tetragenococcus koreensis]MCF1585706.1 GNAT family N-acetyltransferase [Tetragenococcus koreensis]MCF1615339.1 GNAT family N-acetyltransferase [Tetragenococcus koreensis]MCF1625136.1 GNAT family N-acetyltransferase [Tetragenococcus koreensis]MCF1629972.1 GNAT family N-acetyltransferase [Tetragenococcus koreensis]MCF1642874.1 GNAT family N-acetyltransferase [Tetragenococcus koreensis]